jgi:hypothetical protein
MYCAKCGQDNSEQASYCRKCGRPFDTVQNMTPGSETIGSTSLAGRMLRAIRLKVDLYAEVARDPAANRQAIAVVTVAILATAVGQTLGVALGTQQETFHTDAVWTSLVVQFFVAVASMLAFLFLHSLLAYWLSTKVLWRRTISATYGGVLRAVGFAYSLLALNVFSFIPHFDMLIGLIVGIWVIFADITAYRGSLSLSRGQAVALWFAVTIPLVVVAAAIWIPILVLF